MPKLEKVTIGIGRIENELKLNLTLFDSGNAVLGETYNHTPPKNGKPL